jgi:hypothetical protein
MARIPFEINIDDETYFRGLARQEMDFHQSLGELIDNALSARPRKPHGEGLQSVAVEVIIEELENEQYRVIVADHGIGIPQADLVDSIFNPGGQGSRQGQLNEHGFGLKNALALLTSGNSTNFALVTRSDEDELGSDQFLLVRGPWGRNMEVDTEGTREVWADGLQHLEGATTGTKVDVAVSRRYFRTIYRRGNPSFEIYVARVAEHLGVMFRDFIREGNELLISYRPRNGEWTHKSVKPIEIPFEGDVKMIKRTAEVDGNIYEFEYRRGTLKTGVFEEIWPDIGKTVDFNRFVGELRVGAAFRTTNNKTGLDPHSKEWETVLEKLREDSDFRPEKATRSESEESLRDKLITILRGTFSGASVTKDKSVWGGAIAIDIFVDAAEDNRRLYELKVVPGRVLDLYQLQAGWDGLVKDNVQPTKGILVCKSANQKLRDAIEAANLRVDAHDNNYSFEVKEIHELIPE